MKKYIVLVLLSSRFAFSFGWDSITEMLPGWKQSVNITGKVLGIKKEAHVHLSLSSQERALALLKLDADVAEPLLSKEQKEALVVFLMQDILQKKKDEPEVAEDAKQE